MSKLIASFLTLGSLTVGGLLAATAGVTEVSPSREDPAAARRARKETRAAAALETAQALFEQVLRRYAGYRDFQARFVETPISRASGEGTPESGIVSFKRPEMWRWEYLAPERKLVVIRGKTASIAIEGESDVSTYDVGGDGEPSAVGALLSGSEGIGKLFSARYEPSGTREEPMLRLDPLSISDEYDHVFLRIRRRTLTVLQVVVVDPGGNSLRFELADFRADQGLREDLFEPPRAPSTAAAPAAPARKP